jgi:hypothetical protein
MPRRVVIILLPTLYMENVPTSVSETSAMPVTGCSRRMPTNRTGSGTVARTKPDEERRSLPLLSERGPGSLPEVSCRSRMGPSPDVSLLPQHTCTPSAIQIPATPYAFPVSPCPAAYRGLAGCVRLGEKRGEKRGVLLLESSTVRVTPVTNNDDEGKIPSGSHRIPRRRSSVHKSPTMKSFVLWKLFCATRNPEGLTRVSMVDDCV